MKFFLLHNNDKFSFYLSVFNTPGEWGGGEDGVGGVLKGLKVQDLLAVWWSEGLQPEEVLPPS